jgi:hypothetical protein
MDTPDWPHEKIRSIALGYIRKHCMKEDEWRFTRLDSLPERLTRIIHVEEPERAIVSCFVDGLNWSAMTTTRMFGVCRGSQFSCSPLDVRHWRWGDFKHSGRSEVEVATLALANGTHVKVPYETGAASMAPIYYERFWTTKFKVLDKLA